MVRAIRDFTLTDGAGHLPVSGAVPDMFSDTDSFVRLQNVYKSKADSDAQIVHANVRKLCQQVGLAEDFIPLVEVKYYCRNAAFLRCVRMNSLESEYEDAAAVGAGLMGYAPEDPRFRHSMWYVFLALWHSVFRIWLTVLSRFVESL